MSIDQASTSNPLLWQPSEYALLDFGHGRKLERFGNITLDRPSPAAEATRRVHPDVWQKADLRIAPRGDCVNESGMELSNWQAQFQQVVFNLKVTPFGHLGLFPEQAVNWQWMSDWAKARIQSQAGSDAGREPLKALNLFAYTGGTTLALAAAGVEVVHVDASTPAVKWARQNAESSGLTEAPIRWIVEDAAKFVAREVRRGNRYDMLILDPPSFGHGPSGKRWELFEHLPDLLRDIVSLVREDRETVMLLTAHCESPSEDEILDFLTELVPAASISNTRLHLTAETGQQLDAGFAIRVDFDPEHLKS